MKITLSRGPRIQNETNYNTEDLEQIFAAFADAKVSLTDATSGPINYCFKPYVPSKTALEDFADTRWSWHKPNPRPLLVRFTRNADEEGVSKVIGLVHPKALPLSDVERLAAVSGEGVAPAELIFQIGSPIFLIYISFCTFKFKFQI